MMILQFSETENTRHYQSYPNISLMKRICNLILSHFVLFGFPVISSIRAAPVKFYTCFICYMPWFVKSVILSFNKSLKINI